MANWVNNGFISCNRRVDGDSSGKVFYVSHRNVVYYVAAFLPQNDLTRLPGIFTHAIDRARANNIIFDGNIVWCALDFNQYPQINPNRLQELKISYLQNDPNSVERVDWRGNSLNPFVIDAIVNLIGTQTLDLI